MISLADLWLFLAGLVASVMNVVAGGGTLLSFPMLMFAGHLSALAANATSTIGLIPGYITSLWGYRVDFSGEVGREMRRGILPAVVGGALGAWLLLAMGAAFFARIVPLLLILASAMLMGQPLVMRFLRHRQITVEHPAAVFAANFIVALYGGYFGAGMGILYLAAMGLVLKLSLQEINQVKVVISLISNVVGALTLIILEARHPTGAIVYRDALPLVFGALAGGWVGVHVTRKLSPTIVRGFAAAVGVAIAISFVIR